MKPPIELVNKEQIENKDATLVVGNNTLVPFAGITVNLRPGRNRNSKRNVSPISVMAPILPLSISGMRELREIVRLMIGRTLALLAKPRRAFLDRASETRLANETIKSVQIRTSGVLQQVKNAAIDNKKVKLPRVLITPENHKSPEVQKLLQTPDKF